MFRETYNGKYGMTVGVENPKLEAYKQAYWIKIMCKQNYTIISNSDESYTVSGDGISPLTFEKI